MDPTVGIEVEMPIASLSNGGPHDARDVFARLHRRRGLAGGPQVEPIESGGTLIGLKQPGLVTSVDNGFNNLESAIGPVGGPISAGAEDRRTGLNQLADLVHAEVVELVDALAEDGAGILNMAEHPATHIDPSFYLRTRAPKPIYDYWTGVRGWRHDQGIDAKAQNGPTTGTNAAEAVAALNCMLLAAPVFIALFANSPFEDGRLTGRKENRLTIWPRMFAQGRFSGDLETCQPPEQPFGSLAGYFRWMFGAGTAMQALPMPGNSYKSRGSLLRVEGDPPLLEFLAGGSCRARDINGEVFSIEPEMRHFEDLQFSHFLDARIRFFFSARPSVCAFLEAMQADRLEALFEACCSAVYIEGRAAGATFADKSLIDADLDAARSAVMSASALQKGLMSNPHAYAGLQRLLDWKDLRALRDAAIRDGLEAVVEGVALRTIAGRVVELAADGLHADEQWMLAYPEHVLRTGMNGADRLIGAYHRLDGTEASRIRRLSLDRIIGHPPQPHAARGGGMVAVQAGSVFAREYLVAS